MYSVRVRRSLAEDEKEESSKKKHHKHRADDEEKDADSKTNADEEEEKRKRKEERRKRKEAEAELGKIIDRCDRCGGVKRSFDSVVTTYRPRSTTKKSNVFITTSYDATR